MKFLPLNLKFAIAVSVLVLVFAISAASDTGVGPGGGTPGTSQNFQLVGSNPLFNRGMNAALAIFDHFLYVGNRSDGSNSCGDFNSTGPIAPVLTPTAPDGTCLHVHPGILIVDIDNPNNPTVVGEIPVSVAAPNAAGQPEGVTSRELRVWPDKNLLIELSFRCSRVIHDCPRGNDTTFPFDFKFFDLGDPVHPRLISRHVTKSSAGLPIKPHEFFLWIDPNNNNRALLWESTPFSGRFTSVDPARPQLVIEDISDVPDGGDVKLVAEGNWNQFFPGANDQINYDFDLAVHSMAPTFDGTLTHLAYLRGGYLTLDTSDVAKNRIPAGMVLSLNDKLISQVADRASWGAGNTCPGHTELGCSESHSSLQVPGRPFELNVDEVYGTFTDSSFGWPWAWVRLISIADPTHPTIVGEYKIFQNTLAFQGSAGPFGDDAATEQFTSYGSHNPTVLPNIAFDDWHSGGLQAIDISDPSHPAQGGWFSPTPLDSVALEDPALSRGPNKVVMWSYPIIKDGLIYVIDIRNGLYVLRYTGPHAAEVNAIQFLEGNSNLRSAGNFQ